MATRVKSIKEVSSAAENEALHTNLVMGLGEATGLLTTIGSQELDRAINLSLEKIGNASRYNRIAVFDLRYDGDAYLTTLRYSWVKDQLPLPFATSAPMKNQFSSAILPVIKALEEGLVIKCTTGDLPAEIQVVLNSFEVKSLLYVPIIVEQSLWGIFSVYNCHDSKLLDSFETSIFGNFAHRLAATLENQQQIAKLKDRIEQLQQQCKSLEDSVHHQGYQLQEMEQALQTKLDFLAAMSHDLRTPLNGIVGITSLLQRTAMDEEQREYVSTIRNSGDSMLSIINDILDYSKMEAGSIDLEINPFDLRLCIEDVLDLFWLSASEKDIALSYEVSPSIHRRYMGDVSRIRQILVNLVSNAIKYTNKGTVHIEARALSKDKLGEITNLEFKVTDTGIGISADRLPTLFNVYSNIYSAESSGLGLALSQKLVQLMGGTIDVVSEEGAGSTFTFTLPLSPSGIVDISGLGAKLTDYSIFAHINNEANRNQLKNFIDALGISSQSRPYEKSMVVTDDPSYFVEGVKIVFINEQHQHVEVGRFAAQLYPPLKISNFVEMLKKSLLSGDIISYESEMKEEKNKLHELYPIRILVAEDNTINQKLMRKTLGYFGYIADIVANGKEVLDALERQPYDLIFMDIQMPEMDGVEASRQIISKYGDARPRIVAMTASVLGADKDVCMAVGMDDYATKPVKIEVVEKMIVKWNPKAKRFS